jgi:hypothetical protein
MLYVVYAESFYTECHYAECHYAECRGATQLPHGFQKFSRLKNLDHEIKLYGHEIYSLA